MVKVCVPSVAVAGAGVSVCSDPVFPVIPDLCAVQFEVIAAAVQAESLIRGLYRVYAL